MEIKKKLAGLFRDYRNWLICISVLLVLSLAAGVWGGFRLEKLRTHKHSENVPAMTLLEDDLLACTLPRAKSDILMVLKPDGQLLNYGYAGKRNTLNSLFPFQLNDQYGIAGILDSKTGSARKQYLAFAPLEDDTKSLDLTRMVELPAEDAFSKGFQWQCAIAEEVDGTLLVLVAGIDLDGKPMLLVWDQNTNSCEIKHMELDLDQKISRVEIQAEHTTQPDEINITWVASFENTEKAGKNRTTVSWKTAGSTKQEVLYKETVLNREVENTDIASLFDIQYYEDYAFIREMTNGNIHCVTPDGTRTLFRIGNAAIADSDYQYRDYQQFLISQSGADDQPIEERFQVTGICIKGGRTLIVGEGQQWGGQEGIDLNESLPLLLQYDFYWHWFWLVWIGTFLLLFVLVWCADRILNSHKLATRLLICELVVTTLLLTITTAVQYRTDQKEEVHQMELIGSHLGTILNTSSAANGQTVDAEIMNIWDESAALLSDYGYDFQLVVQRGNNLVMAFDSSLTIGDLPSVSPDVIMEYTLLENVRTRAYFDMVHEFMKGSDVKLMQKADTGESFYLQQLYQNDEEGNPVLTGCVVVSQPKDTWQHIMQQVTGYLVPILITFPLLILALLWITRKLLSPLDNVRAALEEFYTCGGGNQMELEDMPRTEIYEMGRVFNQLSTMTQVQMNELRDTNEAYIRMVPDKMLSMLGVTSVSELTAGKTVTERRAILVIAPSAAEQETMDHAAVCNAVMNAVGAYRGIIVDYDGRLNALIALFQKENLALDCGRYCVDTKLPVITAVFQQDVEFGVFGGKYQLYPLILAENTARQLAVLELLRSFGAQVIRCGSGEPELRLLGWDNGKAYYEELSWHSPYWLSIWRNTDDIWADAMELFRQGLFKEAMRQFAKVLRQLPDDRAARWYLFRCDALRDTDAQQSATDLLYEWEES